MPRFKEVRASKKLLARQVAAAVGVDEGTYSKFENYRVLPIPDDFKKIISELECEPSDIYTPDEVALLPSKIKTACGSRAFSEPNEYKMTVRLSNESRKVLTKEVLQKCGYNSINDWVKACVRRLKRQYEIILKAEKKKARQERECENGGAGKSRRGIPLTNQLKTHHYFIRKSPKSQGGNI